MTCNHHWHISPEQKGCGPGAADQEQPNVDPKPLHGRPSFNAFSATANWSETILT